MGAYNGEAMRPRLQWRSRERRTPTTPAGRPLSAVGRSPETKSSGTEEWWVHIIGFADAPTPVVAQPRKANSDNARGVGCIAAVGVKPLGKSICTVSGSLSIRSSFSHISQVKEKKDLGR